MNPNWQLHEDVMNAILGPRDGSSYEDGTNRASLNQTLEEIENAGFEIRPQRYRVFYISFGDRRGQWGVLDNYAGCDYQYWFYTQATAQEFINEILRKEREARHE